MTIILGINAYHPDSAACLLRDGKLIAAVEEERFTRVKHWAGFPFESIRYCLAEGKVKLDEVDIIAINQDSKANLWKKIGYIFTRRPDLYLVINKIKTRLIRSTIEGEFKSKFLVQELSAKIYTVEHHLSHMASAFYVSPFNDAVVVSVDGFGDFASSAWGTGNGNKIIVDKRVYFPHSLGIFYQALTQYLGFINYGDEYKVMGLAPYGNPAYMKEMHQLVILDPDGSYRLNTKYFNHHLKNISYQWNSGNPEFDQIYTDQLLDLLGPNRSPTSEITQRYINIARSVQDMYEQAFFHLLNNLYKRYSIENLALAGGCAMNSVANGKIYRNTSFKKVYIQSAAGDAGGAVGAAFVALHNVNPSVGRKFQMNNSYWGPRFYNQQIGALLDVSSLEIDKQGCEVNIINDEGILTLNTAKAIADGKIVGWFQGRMEWGPRALGNRSILCDPRRSNIKEFLNLKIKRRESFRPFAPSILREYVSEWFEEDDEVPFMMKVFQIKEEKRVEIPAVTHVDGSGRLQTVDKQTNPLYYKLINAFMNITGIPIVLNTSFNENEPIVCKPEEALNCFLRTRMDVLVMGNYLIKRISN